MNNTDFFIVMQQSLFLEESRIKIQLKFSDGSFLL